MIANNLQQIKSLIQGINECEICFESKHPSLILIECRHMMCSQCLTDMLDTEQSSCPFCRKELRAQALPIGIPTKLVNYLKEVEKLLDCETTDMSVSDSQLEGIHTLLKGKIESKRKREREETEREERRDREIEEMMERLRREREEREREREERERRRSEAGGGGGGRSEPDPFDAPIDYDDSDED